MTIVKNKYSFTKILIFIIYSSLFLGCQKDPDLLRISNLKNHKIKNVESLVINNQKDLNFFYKIQKK